MKRTLGLYQIRKLRELLRDGPVWQMHGEDELDYLERLLRRAKITADWECEHGVSLAKRCRECK